jgi:hypothetical protein
MIIAVGLLSGCDSDLDKLSVSDVEGAWISEHEFGSEQLEINRDGTYTLIFKGRDGKISRNTNTWMIDDFGNDEPYLSFDNFAFGRPGYGTCLMEKAPCDGNNVWPVQVTKTFSGKLILTVDPDLYYQYLKQ